ncbi:hypothetical protein FJO98_00025 [Enterococcus sp. PF-2]|uniref:leucine-rich repeat protein n=1 Tax=unclassified Enterococcus TaxID=2608891 RepID=UPI00111F74A6|nr:MULTISPECIES: leucine-rich repeat protein [unclassified Enterococcus]TPE08090.1 hypothetical protein FJP08_00025 [Enterococcus sp. PF-3]TPE29181.1 hypothetical protein FJO98_00025 [Enterococcus sp. PF-2]
MTNKMNRYFRQFSICLILASYVTAPVQISAQESLDEMEAAELVEESTELLDETFSDESNEIQDLVESEETEDLDAVEKNDSRQDLLDSEVEAENDSDSKNENDEEEEEDLTSDSYSNDGYSHVETEPGVVAATTPSDATIPQLIEYLEQHYSSDDITSLTVYGMVETGANEGYLSDFGLAKFTRLSYLEMVDLETVNDGALYSLYSLSELHLPKVKTIGSLALWSNRSLLTLNAPLVEEVGGNAFYEVSNLEVLITPMWTVQLSSIMFEGPAISLKEISTANFSSGFTADAFPNVVKQTINTPTLGAGWNWPIRDRGTWIVFSGVEELTVTGARQLYNDGSSLTGDLSNVKSLSSDTLTAVNLSDFSNLVEIDFDEQLTTIWPNSFSNTKLERLNLTRLINWDANSFVNAEFLKEVYVPSITATVIPSAMNLPSNLEVIGTTSARLSGFQDIANDNPSVLFAATESSERLPLEDQKIGVGDSSTLISDLSSYILNDDLSQTSFELTTNWFYEGELISASDTHSITNMSQNDVGKYHYSVELTPTGSATYSGGRESRIAQIDIIDEINFTSDFTIESVVGELQELIIPFTSNQTNMFSTLQIYIPKSIQVDEQNIQVYLDNGSPLPLNPTVSIENEVITISNYPLLTGFNYHISIPAMPIAISKESDIVSVEFNGNYEPLVASGEVLITSGEFKVAIPELIFFEEVSLNSSSIRTTIEKENQLDIDITSFTGQAESWEILVSASSFRNEDNEKIDESTMRMIYIENDHSFDLTEELFLSSGSFDGSLSYNFQDQTWENNSQKVSQLEDEGFHVFIGEDYYKLEDNHIYTTELNFTIQYSP